MAEITDKILAGLIALILAGAFLPLLSYWDLIAVTNPTINSLMQLIPIIAIIGAGMYLWKKKENE